MECPYCRFTTSSPVQLRLHACESLSGGAPYLCARCGAPSMTRFQCYYHQQHCMPPPPRRVSDLDVLALVAQQESKLTINVGPDYAVSGLFV